MLEVTLRKGLGAGKRAFELQSHFRLPSGAFLGVSGPSGSGKTTLLRCIAGLCEPDLGLVAMDGERWFDSAARLKLPPRNRSVGFVFQDYALFPHMTVFANINYATADRRETERLLELAHLGECSRLFPHELSGGQKQRTALARALGRKPRLLLLDEPMSALEEDLRLSLGEELGRIRREAKVTALLVSHSRAEIERLCTDTLELHTEVEGLTRRSAALSREAPHGVA